MAKMEVDYNLKTSGERFQILCFYLTKIIENLLWFALLAKIHWYLPLDVPGALCVWVKAFNLNFSEVLTNREENPRDTAPLTGRDARHYAKYLIDGSPYECNSQRLWNSCKFRYLWRMSQEAREFHLQPSNFSTSSLRALLSLWTFSFMILLYFEWNLPQNCSLILS